MNAPAAREVDIGDGLSTWCRWAPAPPGRPTVLLVHGWMATADLNWGHSYGALSDIAGVVAPDLHGHGQGHRRARRFRLADCADDAARLLDALGLDRVVVVGYSMGGTVAQLFARRHRDRVHGVVLAATAARFARHARERAAFTSLGVVATAARVTPDHVRTAAALRLMGGRNQGALSEVTLGRYRSHDWLRVVEAGHELGRFDSRAWVGQLDVPAGVVITERDEVVSPARQHALARRIPGALVLEVPGSHRVVMEAPEVFNRRLVEAVEHVWARRAHQPPPPPR